MKYAIVITYSFHPAWLQKTWQEREDYTRIHVEPIFASYAGKVSVRLFDAEAFSTRYSDFMLLETEDLKDYYYMIETLRESQLFKDNLVEFKEVILGIEDGFRNYERDVLNHPNP
ncbi:darcynin family protein [Aquirhabdus parva]|uniref:DUF4286 family protein n=1 Tax=Aquirhabdus parva TaxID=2283318 RepID=A0A345P936_9GAMM|nr:darcynin family protein [Aquirhabdus parva]AXI03795.1 hypothetical protein HYN46_13710 [Aquirhabdus parva]